MQPKTVPTRMPYLPAHRYDRIDVLGWLLLACFAAVLLLSSQSGASMVTYVLALVVLAGYRQWADIARTNLFAVIFVLLAFLAASSFWSEAFSWRRFGSMAVRMLLVSTFVLGMAEVQLRGKVQFWLRRVMTLVGGLALLAAVVRYNVWPPVDGRLNGMGQLDTHVIAALVYGAVAIISLQAFLHEEGRFWRALAIVTIVLAVYAIYFSDSRNAWVSVAIGGAIMLLAERLADRGRFLSSVVSVGLLLGILLVALFLNDATRDLLLPRGTSFRPEIWSLALDRIGTAHMWFGLGILTPNDFLIGDMVIQHPHNIYLSVLYQSGIVGLGLFLLVLWMTLRELLYAYDDADARLALALLGLALPAYLLDGHELLDKIGSTWFLIWLPVAIAVGLRWRRSLQQA
ncbi:MAG: O-antigen ligase family protein [Pseudomonadales bacterium]